MAEDFIAGTVGGFSGKLLDYPFDTVKVLLQTQNSLNTNTNNSLSIKHTKRKPAKVYRGAIHCLTHTIKTNGFLSLYKGITAPLLGSMAENAVLFLSYAEVKRLLGEKPGEKDLTLLQQACAGAIAGGIASWFLNPFEVIKVQMQVMNSASASADGVRKYTGLLDCVKQTIQKDGIAKGLYRGQVSLLLREIPGNFMWYGVYEGVCISQIPEGGTKRDLGVSTHLLGGASAGVAYWTAFYPADTVGSQIRANPAYANRNFFDVLMNIYRTEGVGALYRGWGITAMRAAPAHAAIFAVYEQTMNLFRRFNPKAEDSFHTHNS